MLPLLWRSSTGVSAVTPRDSLSAIDTSGAQRNLRSIRWTTGTPDYERLMTTYILRNAKALLRPFVA